ncbi:JmjC domain-containing histone demethylation protein 1 [Onygenales sp. PD_10]|nr:JmjC domain-containing histone demethylation protein 1 [Onygenales sp. PD_10]
MANSISFRNPSSLRPSRYRTPSPPRHAVEPLSPREVLDPVPIRIPPSTDPQPRYDAFGQKETQINPAWDDFQNGRAPHPASPSRSNPPSKIGHSRSGSTIDTLATIALATSPTFAPLPYDEPAAVGGPVMAPQPPAANGESERPSKRARSEKAPSPTWPKSGARPATSHVSTLDSMKTDAELLLNFARPSNFPPLADISRPQLPVADQGYNDQDTAVRWAPDTTGLWNKNWNISAETKSSSAFFGSNGAAPRIRSRSDGSALTGRPAMNGFISAASPLPPLMGPVFDDEPNRVQNTAAEKDKTLQANGATQPLKPPAKVPRQRRKSVPSSNLKDEDADEDEDYDQSSQARCASCNLDRITVNGEDQEAVTWINCDGCMRWFHIVCAGFKSDRETRTVDKFICRGCRPIHGPTTFVRKSSRARTAIDYAGLNQGFVMSSTETPEHHYIQPIKDGKITFLPDHFARLRPELVTAEYFERGVGMIEPIVIPASWNMRTPQEDTREATTQEEFDEMIDSREEVIDCGQDELDMVIPEGLTVRDVGELYGPEERVEVIDVKSQQGEDKKWNMRKWVDYYYDDSAAKVVRNVISLEVSQCPLGRLIRRPKIVRDLDLQDSVWPAELQAIGDIPKVQFYCLMSVADCYTDFHIDFGGSSVYYHILKGSKTFFFIPPKDKHLKKYEDWCNSAAQDTTFLGDQTKECYRVDLSAGDTMLIPSGWIHAVWTPEDSLVIGGNFLTRMNYGMQIKVAKIEKDTKVPKKFRYPFFQKILWHTAIKYLDEDPIPQNVAESFARDENYRFYREFPVYYEFGDRSVDAEPGTEYYNSRFYSQAELDGLPELAKYLLRTALIAGGYMVDGVTTETRNAVKRSIPKLQGDPVDIIRKFGVWIAWKRGNEHAAKWTRPGAISLDVKVEMSGRKPAGRPSRRSQRHIAESPQVSSESQSSRRPSDQSSENANGVSNTSSSVASISGTPAPPKRKASVANLKEENPPKSRSMPKPTGLGPKRVACDACRKRRIRCRHKDENNHESVTSPSISRKQSLNGRDTAAYTDETKEHLKRDRMAEQESMFAEDSAVLMTPQTNLNKTKGLSPNSSNGKKGRSKACDECRKSKRRCIHDENGRIDPVKAQERSKPRAATSAKRPRSSDENLSPTLSKRLRPEPIHFDTSTASPIGADQDFDGEIVQPRANGQGVPTDKAAANDRPLSQTSYASPPTQKADLVPASEVPSLPTATAPASSLVSPPTSLADDMDVEANRMDGAKTDQNGERSTAIHTPTSTSRHSSRQPRLEPAAESNRKALSRPSGVAPSDLSVPVPSSSVKKPSSRPTSSHRANVHASQSSSVPSKHEKKQQHITPVDKKREGREGSHHSSSHHISPTSPHRSTKSAKHDRGGSFSEPDADPESLRLIRELQEQEFGLRRRGTRT